MDITMRGHCVLWDVIRNEPKWLLSQNSSQVQAQVHRRMDYLIPHYKNRVVHWDVNNEDLHGDFFETKTGDPEYLVKLFHMVHDRDPNVKLFVNDFSVVHEGTYTQAYVNLANDLKSKGAPIYGMGLQSHLVGQIPDPDLLLKRLDLLASTGLALWITELDVTDTNMTEKAQGYEDVYRIYFSTPAIEGILLWGFWNKAHWRPDAALVEGDNFTLNEAGRNVIRLIKQEWYTNTVVRPLSHVDLQEVRAFHGGYNMAVSYDGKLISSDTFYLHKGQDLKVNINISP